MREEKKKKKKKKEKKEKEKKKIQNITDFKKTSPWFININLTFVQKALKVNIYIVCIYMYIYVCIVSMHIYVCMLVYMYIIIYI